MLLELQDRAADERVFAGRFSDSAIAIPSAVYD